MMRSVLNRAAAYLGSYLRWTLGFRLLVLTLITYFLMSADLRFQDISDAYSANEIMLVALGSLSFILLLRALNPLTTTSAREIFTGERFENQFAPGFLQGSTLAFGIVLAFLMSGLYRYLGFFIRFEEAPLAFVGILLRIAGLGVLVYCEEFIFRHKILGYLRSRIPDFAAVVITAIVYCGVKWTQFDLGWSHLLTLFLLSISVGVKTVNEGDFARGAGYWAGILIVFHPLLSIPVFGNEFQGVLLVKYQETETESAIFRYLTGGQGGPLSSFAVQLLFILDVAQGILKNRTILWSPTKQSMN